MSFKPFEDGTRRSRMAINHLSQQACYCTKLQGKLDTQENSGKSFREKSLKTFLNLYAKHMRHRIYWTHVSKEKTLLAFHAWQLYWNKTSITSDISVQTIQSGHFNVSLVNDVSSDNLTDLRVKKRIFDVPVPLRDHQSYNKSSRG